MKAYHITSSLRVPLIKSRGFFKQSYFSTNLEDIASFFDWCIVHRRGGNHYSLLIVNLNESLTKVKDKDNRLAESFYIPTMFKPDIRQIIGINIKRDLKDVFGASFKMGSFMETERYKLRYLYDFLIHHPDLKGYTGPAETLHKRIGKLV